MCISLMKAYLMLQCSFCSLLIKLLTYVLCVCTLCIISFEINYALRLLYIVYKFTTICHQLSPFLRGFIMITCFLQVINFGLDGSFVAV